MLDCRQMARSVFYYQRKRNKEGDGRDGIREDIREIFNRHDGTYGVRRVCMELKAHGRIINHKAVQRLMHEMGLSGCRRRRKYNSYKGCVGKIAGNVMNRNFKADSPLQKCATDVTQFAVEDRKLYLSTILDLFNGEVLCHAISTSPNMAMVEDMLSNLYQKSLDMKGMILHSDQGWQYQQPIYSKSLEDHGIIQSMSRKGNCLDNAMMENFFGLLKNELFYRKKYVSIEELKKDLDKYINYYNNERIKLRLKMSPVHFRIQLANNNIK